MNLTPLTADQSYEIAVELPFRTFKKTIDQAYFVDHQCPAIFKLHPDMLRTILETHLNDKDFFEMEEDGHELSISFSVDLGYGVKEKIILRLEEDGPITAMKRKIEEIEKRMGEIKDRIDAIEESDERLYILDHKQCTEDENIFVMNFKWELANQGEREKYIKLTKKYFVIGHYRIQAQKRQIPPLTYVEPLCLEVSGKRAHVWGWFDVEKWEHGIEIPIEAKIWSTVPRILQHVSNPYHAETHGPASGQEGVLMLYENRLSIVGPILDKLNPGLNEFHYYADDGRGHRNNIYNNVSVSMNKYIVVDARFII